MDINTNLITVGGVELPHVKDYKTIRSKLFTNANRTLKGNLRADLIGIYHNISVDFVHMSAHDLRTIEAALEPAKFSVTYYDNLLGTQRTGFYYAADYETSLWSKNRAIYRPFSIKLIAYDPISND